MTAYTDELQISYIKGKEDALREKSLQDMQIASSTTGRGGSPGQDMSGYGSDWPPLPGAGGDDEPGTDPVEILEQLELPLDLVKNLQINPQTAWAPVKNRGPEEPYNFYPFPNRPPEKLHDIEGTDLTNIARLHNSNTAGDTEYWGPIRNHLNYKSLPSEKQLQKNIQKLRGLIQTSMTPEAQRNLLIQGVKTFKEGGGEALRNLLKPHTVPDQFGHETGRFKA